MKIFCLNGSPRADGSSAVLLQQILAGLHADVRDVKVWHLGDAEIGYCSGCKSCYSTGRCVQRDDVNRILADLVAADLVIVASPSYWGDVTGLMKVFFDRNTPYADTNPNADKLVVPAGKAGVSVAVRAGKTEREKGLLQLYQEGFFMYGEQLLCGDCGYFHLQSGSSSLRILPEGGVSDRGVIPDANGIGKPDIWMAKRIVAP